MSTKEERVLRKSNRYKTDLVFTYGGTDVVEVNHNWENLDQAVYECLKLTNKHYSSRVENNRIYMETYPGKYRSVIDIWRHVKYFIPDTDIFSVMRSLYSFRSMKCIVITVIIFKEEFFVLFMEGQVLIKTSIDELGLMFYDWEYIGLENTGE